MSQPDKSVRHWVAFSHVPGVGPARMAALLNHFGSVAAAWHAPERELRQILDRRSLESLLGVRSALDLDATLARISDLGARVIIRHDSAYPKRLRTIPYAPFVLYVLGDAGLLETRGVAVVGTRRASEYGRLAARKLAGDLAAAGVTIVSGLALGIDSVAHGAALDAGGNTTAVLGCGLDVAYPGRNRSLRARIARHGALVSEYPLGTQPEAGNFPARNRIISGLSLATVVVEAGVKSGALITARYALDQGRDVFAVPGSIFQPGCAGANALLGAGAGVALSADDVLTALDLTQVEVQETVRHTLPADPIEDMLLGSLGAEPLHIDALGRATGLDSAAVTRALSLMELKGLAQHTGGMRWIATG